MDDIYLDYASTTPVRKEVLDSMWHYFSEGFGNTSSMHAKGEEARSAVEEARYRIADFIGAHPGDVYFCSGGTEANNSIILGMALANKGRGNHIITSSIEHHSVGDTCHFLTQNGFRVTWLPVDRYGLVDPEDVAKAIDGDTVLISVMHANNEIGTIEPIARIGEIARRRKVPFHTDAVQTFGHIPVNVDALHVDALSASAHKLYGPKGVGIIYVRRGNRIAPILHGGGQEGRLRAGTQNVPGIVGFASAVDIAEREMERESQRSMHLRDRLIELLFSSVENVKLNGHPAMRLPGNVNVDIAGVSADKMLLALRLEGICASNGSACNSLRREPSHVLRAIGNAPESCGSSLRFTLGSATTEDDIVHLVNVLASSAKEFRQV